jgi:hypothetical protein
MFHVETAPNSDGEKTITFIRYTLTSMIGDIPITIERVVMPRNTI